MKDKEITPLVRLLEDSDPEIYTIVSGKLLEKGDEAIPDLEKAWESALNPLLQEKIEDIIHNIQFSKIKSLFKEWVNEDSKDLLYGAYLVAKYQYPDLQYSAIVEEIDSIHRLVWVEFHDNLTALEKIRIINHIFFGVYKFSGNLKNFYAPSNSFINQVLETKKGNPITLSVIYASVAQKLGLPVFGVNLPLNYILAYELQSYTEDPDGILFYINPFSKGNVLGRKEIDFFLKEQKIEPKPEFYKPCKNSDTIERMLRNLLFSYEKMGLNRKVTEISELRELFKSGDYDL